ncbi:MAG: hypothetical protein IKI63_03090 [Clostridia bacterium]|nr:hypothetical protein [Clostridia bacterium]
MDQATFCTACGTPIDPVSDAANTAETPQPQQPLPAAAPPEPLPESIPQQPDPIHVPQEPVLAAAPPKKSSTKTVVIIAVIAAVVLIVGAVVGVLLYNQHKAEEERLAEESRIAEEKAAYEHNLDLFHYATINGAAKAEESGNLIKSVWYNAIYEERDEKTDPYTRPNGYFVDDFNDALGNLFADSSFAAGINEIKANEEVVTGYMKSLMDPPEGYEATFSAVKECYDAYLTFVNLVENPTGSLNSFSEDFNEADTVCVNKWNALKLYMNDD